MKASRLSSGDQVTGGEIGWSTTVRDVREATSYTTRPLAMTASRSPACEQASGVELAGRSDVEDSGCAIDMVSVPHQSKIWHTSSMGVFQEEVRVGEQGRVVIPSSVRRELGIEPGTVLTVRREGSRLIFEPRSAVRDRLRAQFSRPADGVSLAEELIAERRKEAWRENQDWA